MNTVAIGIGGLLMFLWIWSFFIDRFDKGSVTREANRELRFQELIEDYRKYNERNLK